MKLRKLALAPIAAAAMAFSIPASAATQDWLLTYWGGAGTPTPLGFTGATVHAEDVAGGVDVTVTLNSTYVVGFVDTGNGQHNPFTFNLNGTPDSITVIPPSAAGFVNGGTGPFTNPSFGSFTNAIVCSTPPCAPSGPNPGPLAFEVLGSGITVGSFTNNADGWIFAADVLLKDNIGNLSGLTGTIGNGVPAIPEPETYAMMLAGLGLLGFVARRRRQGLGNAVPA